MDNYPLFVYGTLRPGAKAHKRIRSFVIDRHEATLAHHQMYNFGSFPGIIYRAYAPEPVHGELLTIDPVHYERVLAETDQYEGVGWVFQRQALKVDLVNGLSQMAWVYLARPQALKIEPELLIESNDWFKVYTRV